MIKLRIHIKHFCILLLLFCLSTISVFPEQQKIPQEVLSMVGTYVGSWKMLGIDSTGKVVEKMKWTDTIKAANPIIKDGRAYVETIDKMKFEGGIPPQEIKGTEGYFLNKDGSLKDYFFESFGQVFKMIQLGKNTWVYTNPVIPARMGFLGFSGVISGSHVTVKEITREDGTEVHRISRVTTVNWQDKNGKIKWMQYVSLKGFHKKIK